MQIGLAHYKMMEKADRDKTQGEAAEDAFQAFLLSYPQSPLVPKAEQYLRDVQEVLADGDYKVAYFYYAKADYRASAARLVEVTDRYPLFSQNDDALWMLGNIYERAKQVSKNEDDKNHWSDLASKCYDRIVRDYPLSKDAPGAKARLKDMGRPVPSPDPDAIVRMQKQQLYEKQHHQSVFVKLPLGMLKGSPDVADAARSGMPQMAPPNDAVSATEVLRPGAAGPSFTVTGSAAGASAQTSGSGSEVVTPEDATTAPAGSDAAQAGVGAEIITPLDDKGQPTSEQPAATTPAADTRSRASRRAAAVDQRHSGRRPERFRHCERTSRQRHASRCRLELGEFKFQLASRIRRDSSNRRQRDPRSGNRPVQRATSGQGLHSLQNRHPWTPVPNPPARRRRG